MAEMIKGLVVAGPASGVGKTTVTLALMAAFRKRGLVVQPFKCGPDFIDAGYHTRACGRTSRNLDGWMLATGSNREIFQRGAHGADVCIVEGVMGLFDGASGASEAGSTAEMAKLLGLSVLLVVDASSAARSVAALVHGFETFDPKLKVAGVIFNKVAGPTHYAMLREPVEATCRALALGYLPHDQSIHVPERYLGLFTAGEDLLPESKLEGLSGLAEHYIDLDKLLQSANTSIAPCAARGDQRSSHVRIGVARDRAFCFYYEDNLDALREAGAEVIEFSPLTDHALPSGLDALYLGGGYPELYGDQLSSNHPMVAAVKSFAADGGPVYAECGGLMYLARQIVMREGAAFPMTGVLPLTVQMTDHLVNFGYAEVSTTTDSLWGPAGTRARGHSFHCSTIASFDSIERTYDVNYTLSKSCETEGFRLQNVLASYIHLHFLSSPGFAARFVESVRKRKKSMAEGR